MSAATRALPRSAHSLGHALYARRRRCVALRGDRKTDGYVANILMQAATYAIAVFGLSVVLGLCGQINLAQAAFFALGAYAVGLGTADYHLPFWLCLAGGMAIALRRGRAARPVDAAARRPLSRDGDDLVPADPHRRPDQRDRLHAWARRRQLDQAARAVRLGPGLSRARRRDPGDRRLSGLAAGRYAARPRDARGARQRARRERRRHRRLPHQGRRLRALRAARRPRRRLVRGRLRLCQPRPVRLRRFDRVLDDGAARRRRLADRLGDRHRPADPDPGMAAFPEKRARPLSRDLRRSR